MHKRTLTRSWAKTRSSVTALRMGTRDSKIQDGKDVDVLRSPATGYIKGPCISYDSETQKLFTTPHNAGCANYADWFMILSASGIIISILLSLIAAVFVKFEIRKKFQNTAIGMYQQVSTRNS